MIWPTLLSSLPWSLHRTVEFAFLISFKNKADNEPRCCCRFSPSHSLTAVSHCLWIWIIHGTLGPFREPRCQIIGSVLLWFCPLPVAVRFIVNSPPTWGSNLSKGISKFHLIVNQVCILFPYTTKNQFSFLLNVAFMLLKSSIFNTSMQKRLRLSETAHIWFLGSL